MLPKEGNRYPVVSDDGFRVDRKGSPITQIVITYSEGDHLLEYPLENLIPGSIDVIVASNIHGWCPPYDAEAISDSKKRLIADRIVEAMSLVGDRAQVG